MFELIVFILKSDLKIQNIGEYVSNDLTINNSNILHIAADFGNVSMVE